MIWLAVAGGGALGSMARHAVNVVFAHVLERSVPWATAAVNLIGAAIIGVLAGLIAVGRLHMSTELRTFVFVGILGGFTTFSSYMLDTFTLAHGGEHALAAGNVGAQTALGFLAVWAGYRLAILAA
jgi:fluoride exporter